MIKSTLQQMKDKSKGKGKGKQVDFNIDHVDQEIQTDQSINTAVLGYIGNQTSKNIENQNIQKDNKVSIETQTEVSNLNIDSLNEYYNVENNANLF
jgi:hypothetical protein